MQVIEKDLLDIEKHLSVTQETELAKIDKLDIELERTFASKIKVQDSLNRSLVSYQADKTQPVFRWYKYKEAFSSALIESLIDKYSINQGIILDPFAGSGTALFAASDRGLDADGIEILPIGQRIINTKQLLDKEFTKDDLARLAQLALSRPWESSEGECSIPELRITKGAYPPETLESITKYIHTINNETPRIREVLQFALLCVLEIISYTRKDGQYLRWDYRSGRRQGKKPFTKKIVEFDKAITEKLKEIVTDVLEPESQSSLFQNKALRGNMRLYNGSCLDIMPNLDSEIYDAIITSPPYCNRYDYTRTYALELAILGVDEKELVRLRQAMLSCTVENRPKDLLEMNQSWRNAISVADNQKLLQSILQYLQDQKNDGRLNNNGIPRMVKGYFYEMACVIAECSRVLKSGGTMLMVNDNVRYAGASISVDSILSDFAHQLGCTVSDISTGKSC